MCAHTRSTRSTCTIHVVYTRSICVVRRRHSHRGRFRKSAPYCVHKRSVWHIWHDANDGQRGILLGALLCLYTMIGIAAPSSPNLIIPDCRAVAMNINYHPRVVATRSRGNRQTEAVTTVFIFCLASAYKTAQHNAITYYHSRRWCAYANQIHIFGQYIVRWSPNTLCWW